MIDVDLAKSDLRSLNSRLQAVSEGSNETEWRVLNPQGAHAVAVGLTQPIRVEVQGHVGFYCGGMNQMAEIVVDPVRTREAAMADLHLQIKPGTDAFLIGAMLKMLIQRDAQDDAFLAAHCDGWPEVRASLLAIPAEDWIAATELDPADVPAGD